MKKFYAIVILIAFGITQIYAQQCHQCNGTAFSIGTSIATGDNSFAGGNESVATAENSFVFGDNTQATVSGGIAIGDRANSTALNSIVFGRWVTGNGANSITFGTATNSSPLLNNINNSIMFGVTSLPSLTIVKPDSAALGFVGIGTKEPKEMAHVVGKLLIDRTENVASSLQFKHPATRDAGTPPPNDSIVTSPYYWDIYSDVSGLKFNTINNYNSQNPTTSQSMIIGRGGYVGMEQLHTSKNILAEGNIATLDKFVLKPAYNSTSGYWEISRTSAGLNYAYMDRVLQNILFISNDGLIGVGRTYPAATLDVNGSFKAQSADITGTLTTQKFDVRDTLSANILKAQSATIAGALSANSLNARTASISENAIINGCVGIGTSNPSTLFHINDTRVFLPDKTALEDSASGRYTRTLLRLTTPESGYGFSISYDYGNLTFQQSSGDFNLNTPGGGLTIASNGNVGIGTTNPRAKLDVNGLLKAGNVDITGTLSASILNAGSANITGVITGNALDVQSATINGNANITGTITAQNANFNGKIKTKEVEVTLQGWKDYVFEEDYKLLPLVEVAQFIAENKHLPDVPSAAEVEANGINLGEMNAILIQKVEELTLYILDLQKQINELKTK